ncbi:MAG: hypothetical protein JWO05_3123 [Gemmatimonadetes bacterium]|nr:hypothetical protein [Gemmatimonadota bacterium]
MAISSELGKRVVTAVPAAIVAVWAVFAGGAPLAALLAIAAALSAWELFRMARAAGLTPFAVGVALAGLVPLVVHARYLAIWEPHLTLLALVVPALLTMALFSRGTDAKPFSAAAVTLLGICYTGGMLSFAYAIRYHDYAYGDVVMRLAGREVHVASGGFLLVLPVLLTWATDIGAYAVGRTVGGAKLMPSVSPGKTRSGAIGGVVTSVLVAWLFVRYSLQPAAQLSFTPLGIVLFGVGVSVAGQVGDLVESLLKREAGVKDSSSLIPGHGGVLDRIDSLLFVLPVSYALMGWLLVPAPR